MSEKGKTLKTTIAVGGGQLITIFSGIFKTKVAAILLGPSGVGLLGLLTVVIEMIKSIGSMGIPLSGVREISVAESSNNAENVDFTVTIFQKWILLMALLGAFFCAVFSFPLSFFIFKNYQYGWDIFFLSPAVFFGGLAAGNLAVLQGRRAIPAMVRAGLYSNILAAVLSIGLFYFLGINAIVPSLIVTAVVNFIFSYYYYRQWSPSYSKSITYLNSFPHVKEMIKVGFFIVLVSVFDQFMNLILRSFITDQTSTEGLGLYTAATTIAGMYLTVVLTSLSSDYLPKLAALNTNVEINEAVNLQVNIIVLLASPLIIGMVGFSDVVLNILYSKQFYGAIEILQWQIIGDFFKIIAWPCGFIFLAKGFGKLYTGYSIGYSLIYLLIIILGWDYFGFKIIGFAFFISQLAALVFVYSFFYRKYGLTINTANTKLISVMALLLTLSFIMYNYVEQKLLSHLLNIFVVLVSAFIAYKNLAEDIKIIQKIKKLFKSKS